MKKKYSPFIKRHIGPSNDEIKFMLSKLGFDSLDRLTNKIIPDKIKIKTPMTISDGESETDVLQKLRNYAKKNKIYKSYIGQGYYNTIIPGVIKRNVLENPGWYTQYTPYQAEISQGRLEALLNFQTMVSELTGMSLSNASLLDESTAAAEAMTMFFNVNRDKNKNRFLISKKCHPQTIDVLKTRSDPLGIKLDILNQDNFNFDNKVFGALIQYPDTEGSIKDISSICQDAHQNKAYICVATDLLALTMLKPPGEMGADVAVGNTQRFGVPMGYGGPHAAFFSTREKFKRKIPGRIIGVSKDIHGNLAFRMALQTREQHIRREKATSNICTAQVLLAIMSSMYAIYHGPKGLLLIAQRVNKYASKLANSLKKEGYELIHENFFDTIRFKTRSKWKQKAKKKKINFRDYGDGTVGISIDETITLSDFKILLSVFNIDSIELENESIPSELIRKTPFMKHRIFQSNKSETEMLRYLHRLESKDLSLNTSMIPLGSCTMKLNSTSEMESVTWPEFAEIHPFAPQSQTKGYNKLINELGDWLIEATGFDNISMQPNSGAQGEYTGLLLIRAYHKLNGDTDRDICLIPESAHGTNPASAIMAGLKVVIINCDKHGNISEHDFKKKIKKYSKNLAAIMVTYPSTHGVFEHTIKEICQIVHDNGGQVYLDGANLNALLGLCKPGEIGIDVMHINLHKTFCIPHGGGGPGMGPIVCKSQLAKFLPRHSHIKTNKKNAINAVSSSPFGSSNILPISWVYIAMMGGEGLKLSTQIAILNANYMANILEDHFTILFKGISGFNAHEFIIDLRNLKKESGISDEDVAKRLMDYGFHAPTMSWPVPGTLMIEPTESESKSEMDRFCEAMISIKKEIELVMNNTFDINDNPLRNAPHTAKSLISDNWQHSYSREIGAYPASWLKEHKYWPSVGRIDNTFGDRNLICTCPSTSDYKD
ncbi:MAG: glycine dehydrogenase (aminomethyl-transferring) [Candidatus Marinimicrobia bacterium]|nr:glycine dehydrogenase (aminomethyl-transferring) [Candidatus Neomarinimicrobiota bacterium]|tara:strand:- start:7481 stop:10306 length:2826 start_codon:yes stop_codon:yes gene_type:complete